MSEYVFQLNAKVGVHLINIIGDSQESFESNLKWATENAAGIVSAATALEAAYGVKELAANVTSTTVTNEQAQPAQAAQSGAPGPSCTHGAMKYVPGGTSTRTNRPYKAFWSCTGPRDSQCKTVDA